MSSGDQTSVNQVLTSGYDNLIVLIAPLEGGREIPQWFGGRQGNMQLRKRQVDGVEQCEYQVAFQA